MFCPSARNVFHHIDTLSGLVVLALLAAAFMKFVQPGDYAQQAAEAGMEPAHLTTLGVLLTICALVYAIPMTRVLGAILITGYFGGALAAHMLAGDPIGNFVVPTLIPVLAWLGVYLVDERLRALLPVRRRAKWLYQQPLRRLVGHQRGRDCVRHKHAG